MQDCFLLRQQRRQVLVAELPPGERNRPQDTFADTAISNSVIGYWTRFANTGDPNGAGATMWPAYTMAGDAHLEFGDTTQAGTALHRAKCDVAETWLDGL
jgi:carboxylesterase type B